MVENAIRSRYTGWRIVAFSTAAIAVGLMLAIWVAPVAAFADDAPVYRAHKVGGSWFYTNDKAEIDKKTGEDGWVNEGVVFYDDPEKAVPIYRLRESDTGYYYYTAAHYDEKLQIGGWVDEGICMYANGEDPVYCLQDPFLGRYYYTTSAEDRDGLVANGWTDEGVLCFTAASEEPLENLVDCTVVVAAKLLMSTGYKTPIYDGAPKTHEIQVWAENGSVSSSNYDASYSDNVNAGTATVKVTGKNGYTGSAETEFKIDPAPIKYASVTIADQEFSGKPAVPAAADVVVKVGGRELAAGIDYDASYSMNGRVGTGKATITGKGNYTGTCVATFSIVEPAATDDPAGAGEAVDMPEGSESPDSASSSASIPAQPEQPSSDVPPKPEQPAASGPTAMHRLYNPYTGEHFYTSDDAERDGLVELGWESEGDGWTAPEWSNTPVFRMYNPYAGEHHYCMTESERDALTGAGWEYEGIGWYSDDAKTVPLYRDYNPYEFANNHNYTTDPDEHAYLVSIGWVDEGYAWYGV